MRHDKAVAILTFQPKADQIAFYKKMRARGYDVFFFVDDDSFPCPVVPEIEFINIHAQTCRNAGYTMLNPVISKRKPYGVSAWEKALYYFTNENMNYAHVWFIEDDVFVPSVSTLLNIDLGAPDADMISGSQRINTTGEFTSWPWWKFVPKSVLALPWAGAMVCAVRLSRNLLQAIDLVVRENRQRRSGFLERARTFFMEDARHAVGLKRRQKQGLFIEFLFPTIALHGAMNMVVSDRMRDIEWRRNWDASEIDAAHLYHPVKNQDLQSQFRKSLGLDE